MASEIGQGKTPENTIWVDGISVLSDGNKQHKVPDHIADVEYKLSTLHHKNA